MNFFYTPLEQFDKVIWLSHSVVETIEPYLLFRSEVDFDAGQLYSNSFISSSISFANLRQAESQLRFILIVIGVCNHFIPIIFNQFVSIMVSDFNHLIFLGMRNIFTGAFIVLWFTDFFFIQEQLNGTGINLESFDTTINYLFSPQIDFTISVDEIRVTLILGFFLIGESESVDDEDFILSTEGELNVIEDVVAPLFVANLGKDIAENGSLYLKVCSIFSFVLISNLLGIIPYGDTATSSLILTFWVAFSVFAALVTLIIRKHGFNYFFSLFMPAGCPLPLIFLLIPIEFLSYSFRLVSLSVRLFANRMAGHTLMKVLIGFSYVMFTLGDTYAIAAFLPALVVFVLIFLEMAVAGIQAYIFTILTCIYLKDLYVAH